MDDTDELAPDVAASDAAAVSNVIAEAELSDRLDALNATELRLGLLSITKVCFISNLRDFLLNQKSIIGQLRNLANKIVNSPTLKEDLTVSC